MPFDAHSNFAVSTVATAPSPATSGTSLVVASGEGARFPAVPFNAVVCPIGERPTPANAEVVRVTARTGDSFGTIVRAQEGSTARSIVVGDLIFAAITAKTLTDIENDLISETLFDAKGDLLVGTAADTLARKAVGANGRTLVADSSQSDGLLWEDSPALAYRPLLPHLAWNVAAGQVAGTFLLYEAGQVTLAAAASAYSAFYLDPADYAVGSRTSKVRVRARVVCNAVAPNANFTFHLYPVATWAGASNVRPSVATVGASVASAVINAPSASGPTTAVSADVTFPAAGYYVVALVTSATTAANSQVEVRAQIDMRQVW